MKIEISTLPLLLPLWLPRSAEPVPLVWRDAPPLDAAAGVH